MLRCKKLLLLIVAAMFIALSAVYSSPLVATVAHRDRSTLPGLFAANVEETNSSQYILRDEHQNPDENKALRYLKENMCRFCIGGRVISYDEAIDSFRHLVDSSYYAIVGRTNDSLFENKEFVDSIAHVIKSLNTRIQQHRYIRPRVVASRQNDTTAVDNDFIRRQIEHAFYLRRTNSRVRNLSLPDFLEYILPYRAIGGYPLVVGADTLYAMFSKYLRVDEDVSDTTLVERYNRTINTRNNRRRNR